MKARQVVSVSPLVYRGKRPQKNPKQLSAVNAEYIYTHQGFLDVLLLGACRVISALEARTYNVFEVISNHMFAIPC